MGPYGPRQQGPAAGRNSPVVIQTGTAGAPPTGRPPILPTLGAALNPELVGGQVLPIWCRVPVGKRQRLIVFMLDVTRRHFCAPSQLRTCAPNPLTSDVILEARPLRCTRR